MSKGVEQSNYAPLSKWWWWVVLVGLVVSMFVGAHLFYNIMFPLGAYSTFSEATAGRLETDSQVVLVELADGTELKVYEGDLQEAIQVTMDVVRYITSIPNYETLDLTYVTQTILDHIVLDNRQQAYNFIEQTILQLARGMYDE